MVNRREFLKVLGGSAAGAAAMTLPMMRALASPAAAQDEYFIFIHAQGGWDVTLWSDPRNVARGLMDPATTGNTNITNLAGDAETVAWLSSQGLGNALWQSVPLLDGAGALADDTVSTFKVLRVPGSNLAFGPGIGRLIMHHDKLCLINGVAMNTVAHPDGTAFSATGRHLSGGRASQSSIDTVMANELGTGDLLPVISVRFPSSFLGSGLDPRAVPLRVDNVTNVSRSLHRSTSYEGVEDRDAVTVMLAQESAELTRRAWYKEYPRAFELQYQALRGMMLPQADSSVLEDLFNLDRLRKLTPSQLPPYLQPFFPALPGQAVNPDALNMAFAVEAIKRKKVRCVSLAVGSFDTHSTNYTLQAATQQHLFNLVAQLVEALQSQNLLAHTHIMVVSEFCRTPQINASMGRDHYPNNSALIISPRFKQNFLYGSADADQLLSQNAPNAINGQTRPISPADLLVTFLSAFTPGDPHRHFRDGEVIPQLLVNP